MRVLVVNAGSSTLKLSVIDGDAVSAACEVATGAGTDPGAGRSVLQRDEFQHIDAIGHRIVHGGEKFHEAVLLDGQVEAALRELVDLAPLHQPKSLAALDMVSEVWPQLPAVACFDTAFHTTLPPAARTYALPQEWNRRWALRRYGFHGLSHAWVARRTPKLLRVAPGGLRIVSCHLGAGASLCAIRDGRSVDTTMGFTPLEGLVMATRSGTVDPGLVLWLLEHGDLSPGEMADGLEHQSGLLGLSDSADMRQVLDRSADGDQRARLALDVYIHRLRAGIASMAASLGGLDVLVFTGGVGEHAPEIRERAAGGLGFLGVTLDHAANAEPQIESRIEAKTSAVSVVVLQAREDLEIAHHVRGLLA